MIENQKITKNTVVLYHAECNDGFGAAWAAWNKFGDKADYIPINHGLPLPEGLNGKQIFFVDIIPDEATIKKVINDNKSVVAIDHHKTGEPKMKLFKEYIFDYNHSGAVLAWQYFYPGKSVPKFLLLIEDMDLWNWKYPETDRFLAALILYDFNIQTWDKIAVEIEDPAKLADYLDKGELLLSFQEKMFGRAIEKAYLVEFEGFKVYAANTLHFWASKLGHKLVEKQPPLAIIWSQENSQITVSLRSDGSVDVSEIAKKYGGGGHKAAAGFEIPAEEKFPWKIIKIRTGVIDT